MVQNEKQVAVTDAVLQQVKREADKQLDAFYISTKLRTMFKQSEDKDILKSIWWYVINLPFDVLRNITIPSANPDDWDKFRTIVVTLLIPTAFLILDG